MLSVSCHCKNITLDIKVTTDSVMRCNCSICSKVGALWAYFSPEDVHINVQQGESGSYLWGAKTMAFNHCKMCGCTTHYLTTDLTERNQVAVNFLLLDSELLAQYKVRQYDGKNR